MKMNNRGLSMLVVKDNPSQSKGDSRNPATECHHGRIGRRRLPRHSCNFSPILRISIHGPSDLLSPLYDASRAQVDLGPIKVQLFIQGFLRARDAALAAAGFPFPANSNSPRRGHMTEAVEPKETKAQRAERLKLAKNPWEAFDEVRAFAREGRSSVVPEWAGTYFKWWGIYTQGDGVGATGGKGGEGLVSDYFMMRIGIPNGIVSSHQLRTIGAITRKYARNLADITVRQNIQLHWLTIESLPEVVDVLTQIGMSPKGACAHVV